MMRWLLSLLLLALPAQAQVVPTPGPLDLAALVLQECGPTGYQGTASCTLDFRKYPEGVYQIGPTVLGTCEGTSKQRLGLTIVGRGSSINATVPLYSTSATTFKYVGPPSGTMISFCGSDNWLRDLNIEAQGAGTALEWRANNSKAAISHFGGIDRVIVRSDGTSVCLSIFGETYNDQLDFLRFRDSKLIHCRVGFTQDSQQAVNNTLDNVEITASEVGWQVRNGGANFIGGYVGQLKQADGTYKPDFIGYHLTRTAGPATYMSRANVILRDYHAEIHDGFFVRDDSGSRYPVRLESTQFQHLPQTTTAAARLWSIYSDAPGLLVLDGLSMTASTPTGVTATPRICRKQGPPADVRSLNVTPWMGALSWTCPTP